MTNHSTEIGPRTGYRARRYFASRAAAVRAMYGAKSYGMRLAVRSNPDRKSRPWYIAAEPVTERG